MKTLSKLILISVCLLYLFSCEKDEHEQTITHEEVPFVLPGYEMEFGVKANEHQSRTGQHEIVFFDRNGVFHSTNPIDSVYTIVNLRNIDSIRFTTYWTSPSITVNGSECWIYNIVFYESNNIVYERVAFAKFRGINYKQEIGQLEGYNSDVRFFHSVRNNQVFTPYFDDECLKEKNSHQYLIRERHVNGNSSVYQKYAKSNACHRDYVQYPRNFK